ncbi:MAG TPA: signal peptidase I [Treponema sp.]|nr:signal peptidase I [Treponema sp.]
MRQNIYDYDYELRRARSKRIMTVTVTSVLVIAFLTLFFNLVMFPVVVKSDSMSSEVDRNSVVFVMPLDRNPSRGDIILVNRRDGVSLSWWQNALDSLVAFFTLQQYRPFAHSSKVTGNSCLRRVLALPGDSVYMKDFILYVKPAGQTHFLTEFELAKSPYQLTISAPKAGSTLLALSSSFEEFVLGPDQYFVLADNRESGSDSRVWGAVPESLVGGRAVLEAFPFNKFSLL